MQLPTRKSGLEKNSRLFVTERYKDAFKMEPLSLNIFISSISVMFLYSQILFFFLMVYLILIISFYHVF